MITATLQKQLTLSTAALDNLELHIPVNEFLTVRAHPYLIAHLLLLFVLFCCLRLALLQVQSLGTEGRRGIEGAVVWTVHKKNI